LRESAKRGDAGAVKALLDGPQSPPVDTSDRDGNTVLIIAAAAGRALVVTALLDRGADVDAKNRQLWTALMKAADKGHVEVVKALLKSNADVRAADAKGATALQLAATWDRQQVGPDPELRG
jgi:uncharacterized protein